MKTLEICRVTPSAAGSAGELSLPLTYFDTFWFKFPPVERLFFFKFPSSSSSSAHNSLFFHSTILPKLKHSLSLALLHYLPLAGNLLWPATSSVPILLYAPNDAVSLLVAESYDSDADFNALAGNGIRNAVDAHQFIPKLTTSDERTETFALQITLFPEQGFSVGVTAHHAVLDGNSTTSFLKSWAYLCRELLLLCNSSDPSLPSELVPVLDRSLIKDPTGLAEVYVNHWIEFMGIGSDDDQDNDIRRSVKVLSKVVEFPPDLVWGTFVFTKSNIELLRNRVTAELDESKRRRLSGFVLTFAYTITRKLKALGTRPDQVIAISFTADYRSRLDPPVPANYFGNCVGCLFGSIETAERYIDEEKGLGFTVQRLTEMIEKMESSEGGDDERWEEKAKTMLDWIRMKEKGEIGEFFGVAGSTRFGVYGVDFGWGTAEKVEIVSVDRSSAVAMAESKDGSGGIEIGLGLKRDAMVAFSSLFTDGLKESW